MADNDRSYAIGIMSGTSADGIDAAVLETDHSGNHFRIAATHTLSFPTHIKSVIWELNRSGNDEIEKAGRLHIELAELYFEAIKPLLSSIGREHIDVIGCHGQTVRHRPDISHPFTLQLGSGAKLAQLANLPVVSDFRSADMAAGGQGAPLAPGFHQAAFTSPEQERAVINIGGIANLTHLPSDSQRPVIGFDTGPGNTLMDHWVYQHHNQPYDDQGQWAKQGKIIPEYLELFLEDEYFKRPAPKSTGLEYFNLLWMTTLLDSHDTQWRQRCTPVDIQATLIELTAQTITDQINALSPSVEAVYICGGGAYNTLLMEKLAQHTEATITSTALLGIDPKWIEAAAFAWMAWRTLRQQPSTLPSVTGASKPTVAGAIYFP